MLCKVPGTRPGPPVRPGCRAGTRSDAPTGRSPRHTCARLTATLSRFLLSRNEIPRGTSSIDEAVIEKNTTGACWPWNLSTVPGAHFAEAGRVEMATQHHHLRVVRRDDQQVVLAPTAGCRCSSVQSGPRSRSISSTIACASSGLSVELPSCATVSSRTPGCDPVEAPRGRDGFIRMQPAVVGQPRHRPRTPPGACGTSGPGSTRAPAAACVPVDQPAQRGFVHRLGVGALADLGQLLRVAEQQQVTRGAAHRDGVGQAELPGLLDDQQIEACRRYPACVREIPCGTADHAARVVGDEPGVAPCRRSGPATARAVSAVLLGHPRGVHAGVDHVGEQVLHHGVGLRDDADAPAVLVDQPGDHPGRGERLAGAGRPVHRQVRRIQFQQRGGDDVGVVVAVAGSGSPPRVRGGGAAGCRSRRRRAGSAVRRRRRPRSPRSSPAAPWC